MFSTDYSITFIMIIIHGIIFSALGFNILEQCQYATLVIFQFHYACHMLHDSIVNYVLACLVIS